MRYFLRRGLALAVFMVFLTMAARGQPPDTASTERDFARNAITFNLGLLFYPLPSIGATYERFIDKHFSISVGVSIPYALVQANALYSLWLDNHRLYGGINATIALSQEITKRIFFGPKLGYQYHPRNGGFTFGLNILQWMIDINTGSHSTQTAPLSNPSYLMTPLIDINIGHVF